MELEELIGKIHKESEKNVPEVRSKIITRAKAEGLLELTPSSETVTYNNGSAASLAMRKKGWIAAVVSFLVLAVVCLAIGFAVIYRNGEIDIPPTLEDPLSDKELGDDYAAGVVSTARLMTNYLPENSSEIKPAGVRAAKAAEMPQVNYISSFDGYLNAFGTFFGDELAFSADVEAFDSDKYDSCVSVGGMLANGDPVSYNFYYSEYLDLAKSVDGNEYYYLDGGIELGSEHYRKQFVVTGERVYAAGAATASSLQICIYPDFNNKNTYGKMELEYADDADGTLKKYSYEVISGGKTVDTVKAYKPADGGTAFVIETDGKDGAENGLFSVGKATNGSFDVNFSLGSMEGNFSVVQTAKNKFRYNNVKMGQFTFNLNDDKTCVLTGYDKRTVLPADLVIPADCDGYKVITIAAGAFEYCQDIKSVTVPDGVTSIESRAFRNCSNLQEVKLPEGIKTISSYTFYSCSLLKTINLPEGITTIEDYAFNYCVKLENIDFPETLESIDRAFVYCSSLKALNIPANVNYIDTMAFADCYGIESITVANGNKVFKSVNNCVIEVAEKSLFLGCKNSVIPSDGSVTQIGECAFYGCRGLSSIELPYGITRINDYAFLGSGLENINIPDSVVSIMSAAFEECSALISVKLSENLQELFNAFKNCSLLREIVIPASVSKIYENPFVGCSGLERMSVASGNNYYLSAVGGIEYNCLINISERELISGCQNSRIPNDSSVVEFIGQYAFDKISSLNYLEIPSNITSIGEYAFGECYGLERVDIKEGLSYIGFGAFSNSGLGEIRLPDSVQGVDMEAFAHCQNLRKVELSSNLRGISDRMFYDCTELLSVLFNNDTSNLAFIGAEAFANCRRVNIRIPQSVTGIAPMAFMGSGIMEIVIPNGVTWNNPDGNRVIADSTFKDCQILYTVEIDKNIEVIENQAFYGCKNLNDIRYNGTMEEWKEIKKGAGWDYDTGDYKVYCSDGTLDKNGNVAVNP